MVDTSGGWSIYDSLIIRLKSGVTVFYHLIEWQNIDIFIKFFQNICLFSAGKQTSTYINK